MTTAETIHPETPPSDSPSLASIMDIPKSGHPRNGKIAKLPKELRAIINQMLSEQVTSAVIIEQFAQRGISLNHENVSNWRTGGHQDWLQHQAWLAEIAAERESASALSPNQKSCGLVHNSDDMWKGHRLANLEEAIL